MQPIGQVLSNLWTMGLIRGVEDEPLEATSGRAKRAPAGISLTMYVRVPEPDKTSGGTVFVQATAEFQENPQHYYIPDGTNVRIDRFQTEEGCPIQLGGVEAPFNGTILVQNGKMLIRTDHGDLDIYNPDVTPLLVGARNFVMTILS